MSRKGLLADLVRDSRIDTSVSGSKTKHIFYEPGRTSEERRKCRVECWDRDIVLGRGAYGTVYRERRSGDAGTVHEFRAVKEIKKFVLEGEQLDYTRELEAVIKFSHRNYSHCFVRAEGWFETADSIFIAMEYIELGDLQKYLVHPLPEIEARQIIKQVLEGIGFMHDNGFVHRDLKPGNIMVVVKGPSWFVKIADFGVSKRRKHDMTTLDTLQRGTLGFAAPEVLDPETHQGKAGSYTFAVDIWSLGALAYYMLTNRLAFDNVGHTIRYAMGGDFPIGRLKDLDVSEKCQKFVKHMLAPMPEARPSAVSAAAHEWLATPLTMKLENPVMPLTTEYSEGQNVLVDILAASGSWDTQSLQVRPKENALNYQQPSVETVIFDSLIPLVNRSHSDDCDISDKTSKPPRTVIHGGIPKNSQKPVTPSANKSLSPSEFESHEDPLDWKHASARDEIYVELDSEDASHVDLIDQTIALIDQKTDSIHQEIVSGSLEHNSRRRPPELHEIVAALKRGEKSQSDQLSSERSDQSSSDLSDDENYSSEDADDTKVATAEYSDERGPQKFWCWDSIYGDERGCLWYTPDLRPQSIPKFKSLEEEDKFWVRWEDKGMARRLLWSNDVVASDDHASGLPLRCASCYVEFRPLYQSRCGHWHCLRCIAWDNSNFASGPQPFQKKGCPPIPLKRRRDPRKIPPHQLKRRSTRPILCPFTDCYFTFEPAYLARDHRSGDWVIYCPNCLRGACMLCAELGGSTIYWHPDCPTRQYNWVFANISDHPLPEQPLVLYSKEIQLKAIRDASDDPSRTTPENPWQQISPWGVNKYSSCRQCGVEPEFLEAGNSLRPLQCRHIMCTVCILQWVLIGLVAPTQMEDLCYQCPQRSAVANLTHANYGLLNALGLTPQIKRLWDQIRAVREPGVWLCSFGHATSVSYETGRAPILKIYCRSCRAYYCRWCSCKMHEGRKCPNKRILERFIKKIESSGQLTDNKTRSFLGHELGISWDSPRPSSQ